ncbi:MAG: hypothetical protein AB7U82_32220 [Blastocatellales bacterium]
MNYYNDPDLGAGLIIAILLAVVGSLLIYLTKNHRQRIQFQVKLFLAAFAVRFLASIVIYQFGLINVLKDEDGSGWVAGVSHAKVWEKQGYGIFDLPYLFSLAYNEHHKAYYRMLGAFFMITDSPARLPAAALNCFIGALTVVLIYRVARTLFSEWVAVRVGWLSCLFLSLILWSSQTVKEPIVILLETVALYGCVVLRCKGFSLRHILLCAAAILLVMPFRFYAAYVSAAAVMLTLMLPSLSRRKTSWGSFLAVSAVLIPIAVSSGMLVQREARLDRYDMDFLNRFRYYAAAGGSGVTTDVDLDTPAGMSMGLTVGAAHLLLAPFPWQWGGGLRTLMTVPETLVWWWLFFIGVIPGLKIAIRHRFSDVQPLLFFLLGLVLLYSVMFSNVGLAYRHRAQLLPFLLIFAMVGLEQRAIKQLLARRAQMAQAGAQAPALVRQEAG